MIVIDKSGSMNSANRMNLAIKAAKAVVRTLSWVDFVNVIAFDSETSHAAPHMVPATDANKAALNNWIDSLNAGGTTNYRDSLTQAFELLSDSRREDRLS